MYNQATSDPDLVLPRGNPTAATVLFHSEAYTGLIRAVRIYMPFEAAGALVGRGWQHSDGHPVIEVTDAVPIDLAPSERGLVPDKNQWENLKNLLATPHQPPSRIVGWYYSYPGADGPGSNPEEAEQFMFIPHLELLLLVSPAEKQGAFYTWQDNRFMPTGGFYEVLSSKHAQPVIPWEGQLSGLGSEIAAEGEPDDLPEELPVEPAPAWPLETQQAVAQGPVTGAPEPEGADIALQPDLLDVTDAPGLDLEAQPQFVGLDEIQSELVAPLATDEAARVDPYTWEPPVEARPVPGDYSTRIILVVLGLLLLLLVLTAAAWQIMQRAAQPAGPSSGQGSGITLQSLATSAPATAQALKIAASTARSSTTPQPPTPSSTLSEPPQPAARTVLTIGDLTKTLALEDTNFTGGFLTPDYRYRGRSARLAYGAGTPYSTLDGRFNLNLAVVGRLQGASVVIVGLNSAGATRLPLRITLNGETVHEGPSPFPTDLGALIKGPGNWGSYTWRVDPGLLRQGGNLLQIANLDPSADAQSGPFFALDKVDIQFRGEVR